MPNTHFKSKIRIATNFNFLLYNSLVCPMACLPAVRPSSTMARVQVFSHKKGNHVGFTKPLFRKTFIHCTMVLPFTLC